MKCERCHRNEATQAVRSRKDGEPEDLFVCDQCARATPKTAQAVSLADILFSLGMPPAGAVADGETPAAVREADGDAVPACPSCGLTRDVLRDRRRFGCPVCYTTFEEDVRAFIRELQYGDTHVGRTPRKVGLRRRIAALREELAEAITAQRYEEAAQLRDRLKSLEAPPCEGKEPSDGRA